ncbi:MAG: hypothetical protein ACXW3T_16420, partial [Rhodoplanes sp.]
MKANLPPAKIVYNLKNYLVYNAGAVDTAAARARVPANHQPAKTRRQQGRNSMSVSRYLPLARGILLGAALAMASTAAHAQKREFSFAYDQPKNSGYGIGAEMFNKKLGELSKGTLSINQYPGAQLGTEAQTLQKVQTGDIDFVMLS